MPNHVFSTLDVTAKTPEELAGFIEKARMPYAYDTEEITKDKELKAVTRKEAFSFHNFVPAPLSEPRSYGNYTDEDGKFHQPWYVWNVDNWDTKWDAYDVDFEVSDSQLSATYRFTTAWSPPIKVILEIAHQYPSLHLNYEYEEEQGWGGIMSSDFGDKHITHDKQWDIPNSHADHDKLEKECVCEWESDTQYWFEDCPREEE